MKKKCVYCGALGRFEKKITKGIALSSKLILSSLLFAMKSDILIYKNQAILPI